MTALQTLSFLAMILQIAALVVWTRSIVRKHVETWIYVGVVLAMIAMLSHRVVDLYGTRGLMSPLTSLTISSIALVCVIQTGRSIRHKLLLEQRVNHLSATLTTLHQELENRGHVAERLAVILNDLRDEIGYYESLAKEHGIPLFKDAKKSGGADEARTR